MMGQCINTQVENAACCTLTPYPYDTYYTTQHFNMRDSSFDKHNACPDALRIQIKEDIIIINRMQLAQSTLKCLYKCC